MTGKPDKILQIRILRNLFPSSRSAYWNFVWMIRDPNAISSGLATLPVSLGNRDAYFISNLSYGIRSAILIQRFSGFIWRPIGWLKSRNECCDLSIGLYMVLPLYSRNLITNLHRKCSHFFKTLVDIILDIGIKTSKIKYFCINQQTLFIQNLQAIINIFPIL